MQKEDALVRCPYYRSVGRQSIHCEGVTENCGLRLGFATFAQRSQHRQKFCRRDWAGCPVAGMLNRLYDYEP